MTSIVDVAKKAQVSVTTVSRVLNNSDHQVNEKTRQRVLEAAEALNFRPNALARALVSERSKIIGVIVGDASDPYFATIIRGISDVAREQGYLTIICNSDRVAEVELNYIRMLMDYRADGIIFAGGALNYSFYNEQLGQLFAQMKAQSVAVVSLGNHLPDIPKVTIDNFQSTLDMTEYLIGLGHRRIGYISGPPDLMTSSIRLEGYKQALARHQIPFIADLVVDSDFTFEQGQELTEHFLNLDPWPTAIFGSNDRVAIGSLVKLKERGIDVPGQISVVGFDNISSTLQVDPPLTTIHVPMHEMGSRGMKQLLNLLDGKPVDALHELPYELLIRGSSGPANPAR
jgi:LacI family transcriptional regulator